MQAGFRDYIEQADPDKNHPDWHIQNEDGTYDEQQNIYNYLTSKELDVEVSDQDYIDLMVWHRGLAVPAARNVDDEEVLKGKELFEQIGCTYCHKPSWTTGDDEIRDPARFFVGDKADQLPRYPNQKIYFIRIWYSTSCTCRTISARAGAAPLRFGDAACTSVAPEPNMPTACTIAAHAPRWKPSCGTAPAPRATLTNKSKLSATSRRKTVTPS